MKWMNFICLQVKHNLIRKTQLQLYLEQQEHVLDRKGNANLDVLKFWKDNMNSYPELSLMAKKCFKYTY
uniref:Putative ovule protein n=1 Tax=Solanum chacoense TaxID=4108 RepID=A0A0V0H5Y4_SOLCH